MTSNIKQVYQIIQPTDPGHTVKFYKRKRDVNLFFRVHPKSSWPYVVKIYDLTLVKEQTQKEWEDNQ